MMQFGFRAHDFGRMTIDTLAQTFSSFAPVPIQLALHKALVDPPPHLGTMSSAYASKIRTTLAQRGISIGVLGCYINPIHPDDGLLDSALQRFEEYLRYASDFGCLVVGTETGSANADCSFHPQTSSERNFDRLCRSVERLVRTAERHGAIVGVEAVARQHTIDSCDKMVRLLDRIDSPSLQVIYDPVNLLPWEGLAEVDGSIGAVPSAQAQTIFFSQAFSAFGDKIVAIHLKDFRYVDGWKQGSMPPLAGDLDTVGLLELVSRHRPDIDILLENCEPRSAEQTIGTLRRMVDPTS